MPLVSERGSKNQSSYRPILVDTNHQAARTPARQKAKISNSRFHEVLARHL